MENRRLFIKKLGLATGAIAILGGVSSIYGATNTYSYEFKVIDVKGRVTSNGKGLKNVIVTDGIEVVSTDAQGHFQFTSSSFADFVYISIPSGYEIDQLNNGSAHFFKPLDKFKNRNEFDFRVTSLNESDNNHSFLLLADTQIQNEYEANQLLEVSTPDFIKTIQNLNTPNVFGIGCGDLVYDKLELFSQYNEVIKSTTIPFFQVIGNHDMDLGGRSEQTSTKTFNSLFGPTFYSFNRGEIHYIVLDDVFFTGGSRKDYIGYITENQFAWLEKDLSFIEAGRTVVLSLHIPVFSAVKNKEHLYDILAPYKVHILSGHTHTNSNDVATNRFEHCHGTVCGSWWSGPICPDGTPNGYGVYSARGSNLSWYYKSVGKEKEYQFRVYPKGALPEYPNSWCLNVWNWNPNWQIAWYENGIKRSDIRKKMAVDPLSVKLHLGPKIPVRREWVEPYINDHMFFFEPNEEIEKIVIEVIDDFGNAYLETIKL